MSRAVCCLRRWLSGFRSSALLRLFVVPALAVFPFVFFVQSRLDSPLFAVGVALATFLSIGQFSFWGNYLPRVYPTHLRGTGESFAVNIGGRIAGSSGVLLTAQLSNIIPVSSATMQLAYSAGITATLSYAIALAASFWLPEPVCKELPE